MKTETKTNVKIKAKLVSDRSITIVTDSKPITVRYGQPLFNDAYVLARQGKWEEVVNLLDNPVSQQIDKALGGNIGLQNGEICYKGKPVHNVISRKILSMLEQGNKDYEPWVKFVDKLYQNPPDQSRSELFDFMSYKELPITDEGDVVAWKGVSDDNYSCHGNQKTVVLQGNVDKSGRIENKVGATIEVERGDVDSDRSRHCSYGLHVGSWDYASTFGTNIKMVSFNPKDAVSVPNDCGFQKLRVCKYEVMQDYKEESDVDDAVLGHKSDKEVPHFSEDVVSSIESYVQTRLNDGAPPSVKQIQSRMKGVPLSSQDIVEIIQELGFFLDRDENTPISRALVTW